MIGQDSMSYQRLDARQQPSNTNASQSNQRYSGHTYSGVSSNMSAPLWQFRAQPHGYEAPNGFETHQAPRAGFGETYSTAMADMHRNTTNFVNQTYVQRGYDDRVHAGIYVDPNTKEVFDLWEESMPERQRDESLNPDAHAMDRMFHQATGNTFAPDFQDHLDPNANDPDALDHMGYRSFKPEENNMEATFSRHDRYVAETGYGHAHAVWAHTLAANEASRKAENSLAGIDERVGGPSLHFGYHNSLYMLPNYSGYTVQAADVDVKEHPHMGSLAVGLPSAMPRPFVKTPQGLPEAPGHLSWAAGPVALRPSIPAPQLGNQFETPSYERFATHTTHLHRAMIPAFVPDPSLNNTTSFLPNHAVLTPATNHRPMIPKPQLGTQDAHLTHWSTTTGPANMAVQYHPWGYREIADLPGDREAAQNFRLGSWPV
jgi:hypothetical protein